MYATNIFLKGILTDHIIYVYITYIDHINILVSYVLNKTHVVYKLQ